MSPPPPELSPDESLPRLTLGQQWQRFTEGRFMLFTQPGLGKRPQSGISNSWETFTDKLRTKYAPQSVGLSLPPSIQKSIQTADSGQPNNGDIVVEAGQTDPDDIFWRSPPPDAANLFALPPEPAPTTGETATDYRAALSSPSAAKRLINFEQPGRSVLPQPSLRLPAQPSLPAVAPVSQLARPGLSRPALDRPDQEKLQRRDPQSPMNGVTSPSTLRSAQIPSSPQPGEKIALRQQRWLNQIERSSYGVISHRLKSFLGSLLDLRVPNVKIYASPAADALARQFQADAVTYDDKILFRTGGYAPQQPEGLALLGHELTHIAARRPGDLGTISAATEEAMALENEQRVLNYATAPTKGPLSQSVIPLPLPQPAPRPLSLSPSSLSSSSLSSRAGFTQAPPRAAGFTPKTAKDDRPVARTQPAAAAMPDPNLSQRQLDQVYHYIKAKIRESGERWGTK